MFTASCSVNALVMSRRGARGIGNRRSTHPSIPARDRVPETGRPTAPARAPRRAPPHGRRIRNDPPTPTGRAPPPPPPPPPRPRRPPPAPPPPPPAAPYNYRRRDNSVTTAS